MSNNPSQCTVLHIASGDLWAGAEVQLHTLARKQAEDPAISVSAVLLNHGKLEQELVRAGIPVTVINEAETGSVGILSRLVSIIRTIKVDIVHTHRTKENILGSIAGLLAGRVPSIRTVHGAPEHKASLKQPHKYLISFIDSFCARHLQKSIVAVSADLSSNLAKVLPADRICVIENGIDIADFNTHRLSRKNRPDSGQVNPRVGIAGRLVPVKRVDIFIRIAHELAQHHKELNATFHIYGDGPLHNELRELARELGVSDIVFFEGHNDDIHTQLASLDVLMMTSDHEGTPMILLEALAIGVPVIAHSTGGISDLLNHGECGVLIEEHTPPAYADALVKLVGHPGEAGRLIETAICPHLSGRFSADRNAQNYAALYRDLIYAGT